ncbi:MAG: HAMP domain-containing histidine kinase [Clostridia bacterium]|nr:HAMP domain-containing histidine kinase [Clostridia bacterium]
MKRMVLKRIGAVLAVSLGLYLISSCVLLGMRLLAQRRNTESDVLTLNNSMDSKFADPMFPFDPQNDLERLRCQLLLRQSEALLTSGADNGIFYVSGLINENGELLVKSESMLIVGSGAPDPDGRINPDEVLFSVYLDDYLTDGDRRTLTIICDPTGSAGNLQVVVLCIRSASFAYRDGAPVPVSITVLPPEDRDFPEEFEMTLTFSDLPAEKTYTAGTDGIGLQLLFFAPEGTDLSRAKRYAALKEELNQIAGEIRTRGIDAVCGETGVRTRTGGLFVTRSSVAEAVKDKNGAEYCAYTVAEQSWATYILGNFLWHNQMLGLTVVLSFAAAAAAGAAAIFAVMQARREAARRLLLVSVAHELKTPVAVMQNQCECLTERVAPEKDGEYLRTILTQTDRLDEILDNFAVFGALSGQTSARTVFSLRQTLLRETEKYRAFADAKSVRLTVSTDEVRVRGDEAGLSLVIDNYLSNAIRYSEGKREIVVRLVKRRRGFALSVYNACGGIPKKEKNKIWKPFYRVDGARSDGGSGLGLAICAVILKNHSYRYGFFNGDGGVTFYFASRRGRVK